MSINFVPDLIKDFPHLNMAHKDKRLVVFVGAGLSALWGCKRWNEMAQQLISSCYNKGLIDFWEKDGLIKKYASAPRKLITIAKSILQKDYHKELEATLITNEDRKSKFPDLYKNLFSFGDIFITTNIDTHFSNYFDEQNIHIDLDEYTKIKLCPNNIVHIHGAITHPNSLVLTIEEYMTRYKDEKFVRFLESIFLNEQYCILFMGYGVDEMELIDFLFQKYRNSQEGEKFLHRFYILLPYFRNEEKLFRYEEQYFEQINTSIVPFAKDRKGYDQLDEIVSSWRSIFHGMGNKDRFYQENEIIERNL